MVSIANKLTRMAKLKEIIREAWTYSLRDKLLEVITLANRGANYPPSIKEGEIANAVLDFLNNGAKNNLKKIPDFKNEDEEDEFWSKHDSTEYIDYSKGLRINMSGKRKPITFDKYDKIMGKIIKKGLSVPDTLIAMLNEAGKYDLIDGGKNGLRKSRKQHKKRT